MAIVVSTPAKLIATLMMLAALAAGGIAAYLAYHSWTGNVLAACLAEEGYDCDSVLATSWSRWLGVPVAALGTLVYLAIAAMVWPAARSPFGAAMQVLVGLVVAALGSALWFIGLQVFDIQIFCPFCMTTHACGILIALLTPALIHFARRSANAGQRLIDSGLGVPAMVSESSSAWGGAGFGLLAVVVLVVGQWIAPSRTETPMEEIALTSRQEPTTESTSTEPAESEAPDFMQNTPVERDTTPEPTGPTRLVSFTALSSPVDVYKYPHLGDPEAKYVVVEMLDYGCRHCRQLHPRLMAARERYGSQLCIVLWFVPLESKCNDYMDPGYKGHRDSCEYARLAYSVWQLAPEKFPEFHNWLMAGRSPRSVSEARQRAMSLVGERVLLDDGLKRDIFDQIGVQCEGWSKIDKTLPLVVFPEAATRGVADTDREVFDMFEQKLGIQPVAE